VADTTTPPAPVKPVEPVTDLPPDPAALARLLAKKLQTISDRDLSGRHRFTCVCEGWPEVTVSAEGEYIAAERYLLLCKGIPEKDRVPVVLPGDILVAPVAISDESPTICGTEDDVQGEKASRLKAKAESKKDAAGKPIQPAKTADGKPPVPANIVLVRRA
jgi:hypothetical protein